MLRVRRSDIVIVVGSIAATCAFASLQHHMMGWTPTVRTYIVPATVGTLFGVVVAIVVRLRRRVEALNARLAEALATTSDQLAATRAQLVRTGRQQTVGVLAGGVAHDLNNLFTVMVSSLPSLHDDSDEERREALASVKEALERAQALSRRLMQLGRPPATPTRIDLAARVRSVEPLVVRVLKPRTQLVWETATPADVLVDSTDVDQLVLNLLLNACNALPDSGGEIVVRVERQDGRARLVVKDSGVGMDAETKRRLFEPFFTRRADNTGTGLGLAVVHDVVERARASIDVQSTPGKGTSFTVDFPLLAG